jgi:DNA-directed RNA polymerase specialized sigma24 family protein
MLKRSVHTAWATNPGQADPFAATQWSMILAAAETQADLEGSSAALAALCQLYWPPLYTYARIRGHTVHDAQDLTQGFFAYLLEHKIYKRADPERGKFRSFLLASYKNFLSDMRDRAQALKRGGGRNFVPLDEKRAEQAESLFKTHHSSGERLFERSWAETLVAAALERVAAAYAADGKEKVFNHLKIFLTVGAAPPPAYADLAALLGIAESTLRSHVTRLRARYRDILRAEVRRTVKTDAEVDAELRELLRVLTST